MFTDDDEPKRARQIVIGEDLSMISVGELEDRISQLEAEISRIRADIEAKQSSKSAAEAFFRPSGD